METSFYWKDGISAEDRLERAFAALNVSPDEREAIRVFMGPLRLKGPAGRFHYEHSIRVGLLAKDIAQTMGYDTKALFYAGLLHDVGKALVPMKTLGKTDSWTAEDQAAIEPHVRDGYRLLRDKFDFTAEIILWHHRFQPNCYPATLPPPLHPFSKATSVTIETYGRLLMMADVFDALHRVNVRDGQKRVRTGAEIKQAMLECNPDQKPLVTRLYDLGIFPMWDASG